MIKVGAHCNFETKSASVFNFGSRSEFSNIIFKINELNLLSVPNFIALGMYFIFGIRFSWNEEIYTPFNVEYVLLGCNFGVFGGYLVFNPRYLAVPTRHCSLLLVTARYWWLLLVTACYCSFPLLVWTIFLWILWNF